jgi:pimeloyl-ACP methyl ester carboxylesterase
VAATVAAPPRPAGTVDELVSVGGARMHVGCTGSGQATVLLIAGFTGDHTDFAGIEPRVTEMSRVCSYDRFGTGTSDPPPTPQTFTTQARVLHDALETLGEPGPFVVVGHSFGGPVAVTFTSLYPSDVHGVLLLDASPPTWNAAACSVADDGSAGADLWVQTCAMQANNIEGLDGPAAFAEVATIRSLGEVPMIVATASDHDYNADDFDPAAAARLTEAWFDGQDHWASLSPNSRLISVDNSGHYIQRDQPDLVIEQITSLLHNPS